MITEPLGVCVLQRDGKYRVAPRAASYSAQNVRAALEAERAMQTRRWVVAALAALVIVAIAIALMVPAISMTSETLPAAEEAAMQAQGIAADNENIATVEEASEESEAIEELTAQAEAAANEEGGDDSSVAADAPAHAADQRDSQNNDDPAREADYQEATHDVPSAEGETPRDESEGAAPEYAEDAEEPMPEQGFYGEVRNKKGEVKLAVQVDAPEGSLPEGTIMEVSSVKADDVQDAVDVALSNQQIDGEVQGIQAVDITFKDAQGWEIEPLKDVAVTFTAQGIADAQQQPVLVHIDDAGQAAVVDSLNKQQAEARNMDLDADQLAFEAQDFSVYALVYTVDFEYTPAGSAEDTTSRDVANEDAGSNEASGTHANANADAETGGATEETQSQEAGQEATQEPGTSVESYKYSMQGDGSMMLSDLFANLAISHSMAEVKDVNFTNYELLAVSQVVATGDQIDWRLKSLQPFDSTERLDVTLQDGSLIHIKVTDAQQYVAGKGSGKISVSKEMVYAAGMNKLSSGKIQLALTKDGEFVRSPNDPSKPYVLEMNIQSDGIRPPTVIFEGLEDGDYDVWEVHGDVNNGTINRSYDGMLLQNDTVELESIRVVANSNGQQTSSGLYNNNATIKNGSTASMTFRNTYRPATDKTSFEANKAWMDRKENFIQAPEGATVAFTLFKRVNGVTTSTGQTIVLDGVADGQGEKNPWQAVFADLPKTENGQQIRYLVKETSGWPDYYACKNKGKNLMNDEYLDSSGGTIYNRHLLATIQIQKHFDIQPNKYSDADWAEVIAKKQLSFELTNQDTNETWYFTLDDTFKRDGQLFYFNVENMQAGHYILKEYRYRGLITDRKWDRGITEYERYINPGDNMDNPLFEMEVQNWYVAGQDKPEGAYVKALKVWDDLDDFDGIRPSSVTVRLSATVDGKDYPDAIANVANPIELTASNGWTTGNAWYNLPELDPNGKKIEYTVEEVAVPEGYTCTTSISENGTDKSYTFTNTHRPQGNGKVKIKKVVDAPAGASVPSTYYFTIQDSDGKYWTSNGASTTAGYYTAVPVQTNSATGEVELELPVGKYTISEVRDGAEISGYTLTVTGEGTFEVHANQNQEVVVTNKYEESGPDGLYVTKKWLASDGVTDISSAVERDSVKFRLYYAYDQYNKGVVKDYTIRRDGSGAWIPVSVELPDDPKKWNKHCGYYLVELDESGNEIFNANLVAYEYKGKDVSISDMLQYDSNGTVTIVNKLEEKANEVEVLKKWEGSFSDSEKTARVQLKRVDKAEGNKAAINLYTVSDWSAWGYNTGSSVYPGNYTKRATVTTDSDGNSIHVGDKVRLYFNYYDNSVYGPVEGVSNLVVSGDRKYIDFVVSDEVAHLQIHGGGSFRAEILESADKGADSSVAGVPENCGDVVELNSKNSWYHKWTGLEAGYTYFVEEVNPGDGVSVSYTYKGDEIPENGIDKGLITVTNTKETPQTGSVQVTKTFEGIDASQIPNDFTITATWEAEGTQTRNLTVSGGQQDGVTLTNNGTTYTWTIDGLPLGTTVTFAESNYGVEGYSVATSPAANAQGKVVAQATANVEPGVARFVNTYTEEQEPTLDVMIKKVGSKDEPLAGATFELYRHNGSVYEKLTANDYAWLAPDSRFVVPAEGFTLSALTDGVYQLKEIVAPGGYVIQEDTPVSFTVQDGKIVRNANVLKAGAKYEPAAAQTADTYTVVNTPGRELPSTGGVGLPVVYAVAALLLALAAGLVTLSRRSPRVRY